MQEIIIKNKILFARYGHEFKRMIDVKRVLIDYFKKHQEIVLTIGPEIFPSPCDGDKYLLLKCQGESIIWKLHDGVSALFRIRFVFHAMRP